MRRLVPLLTLAVLSGVAHAGSWLYQERKNIKFADYSTWGNDVLNITLIQNKKTKEDKQSKDDIKISLTLPDNNDCHTSTSPFVKLLKGNIGITCKIYISAMQKEDLEARRSIFMGISRAAGRRILFPQITQI